MFRLFLLIGAVVSIGSAQTLQGSVVDGNSTGLSNCLVAIKSGLGSAQTTSDGSFIITGFSSIDGRKNHKHFSILKGRYLEINQGLVLKSVRVFDFSGREVVNRKNISITNNKIDIEKLLKNNKPSMYWIQVNYENYQIVYRYTFLKESFFGNVPKEEEKGRLKKTSAPVDTLSISCPTYLVKNVPIDIYNGTLPPIQIRRPNILLIVSDDQGYADMSVQENASADVSTPHMDALAASGVRFRQAYVSAPICNSARAGIISGRYQQRWGNDWYSGGQGLPQSETTIAEALKVQGYTTGYIGKVHYAGTGQGANSDLFPLNHGFDSFFGMVHHTLHFTKHTQADLDAMGTNNGERIGVGPYWVNDQKQDREGYSTEIFGQEARNFINQNKDKPFFLQLAFNAVHNFVHQFSDSALTANALDSFTDWTPSSVGYNTWYNDVTVSSYFDVSNTPKRQKLRKLYLLCLKILDDEIGKIVAELEKENLRENTLIIYITDNGGSPRTSAINTPLSQYKYGIGEGGIRIPFIISWPGTVPGGKVSDEMISSLDILPTSVIAGGGTLPTALDGKSLWDHVLKNFSNKVHDYLFWRLSGGADWAVNDGQWKLRVTPSIRTGANFEFPAGNFLYDLNNDIGEMNNLHSTNPDIVNRLTQQYNDWLVGL